MNTQSRAIVDQIVVDGVCFTKCAVCEAWMHPEDYRPDLFVEAHAAALHEKHGPNVCFGCMDEAGRNETTVEDEWL